MFCPYISEFGILALAHFVAVASPGPDFAVVVRQSLTQGRNAALWTSLEIGTGIFLHVTYSLLGIGIIVSQAILVFSII
jgi:threonine/homoserine/homoserine lactone efflux protein